jgi:uracil-DNA glycosylase
MGVRLDGSAKGNIKERISSSEWVKYEDSCWGFLQKQIFLQKPLVIVVFGEDNRSDLMTNKRLGSNWTQTLQYTFESDRKSHSAFVTFVDHPHSLIRNTAKDAARIEVKRIRELYESQAQGNR